MKKIIKPSTEEESVTYSDFSGKLLQEVPVNVALDFNYGSVKDGDRIVLDLTDEEGQELLEHIKGKLSPEAINNLGL